VRSGQICRPVDYKRKETDIREGMDAVVRFRFRARPFAATTASSAIWVSVTLQSSSISGVFRERYALGSLPYTFLDGRVILLLRHCTRARGGRLQNTLQRPAGSELPGVGVAGAGASRSLVMHGNGLAIVLVTRVEPGQFISRERTNQWKELLDILVGGNSELDVFFGTVSADIEAERRVDLIRVRVLDGSVGGQANSNSQEAGGNSISCDPRRFGCLGVILKRRVQGGTRQSWPLREREDGS
jgi:hypothetical protein